jgi:hypothetical protein
MRRATLSTRSFSYSQTGSTFRTTLANQATARTSLGRVQFVDFYKHGLRRYRLILKLCFQHAPAGIIRIYTEFASI